MAWRRLGGKTLSPMMTYFTDTHTHIYIYIYASFSLNESTLRKMPPLVELMAYQLFGTKSLSESMVTYSVEPCEQTSVILKSKHINVY